MSTEEKGRELAPTTPEDRAVAEIRRYGASQGVFLKESGNNAKLIAGLTWGSGNRAVQGSSFSDATRHAIARWCAGVEADILTEVDILGGNVFLNSKYWENFINASDQFHHYEQRDVSLSMEELLRGKAEELDALVVDLDGPQKAKTQLRAFDYREEADEIAISRQKSGARETATHVIETTIYRFMNVAPLESIKAGRIEEFDKYLVPVTEYNWAGGMEQTMANAKKWDPIGDAHPGNTARTRSLRRCAAKAFSARMKGHRERMRKAEEYLEADFEIIRHDDMEIRAQLPAPGGPQAVSSNQGEPEAVNPKDAVDLPFEGEPVDVEPVEEPPKKKAPRKKKAAKPQQEPDPAPPTDFDLNDRRRGLFATLKDAGVPIKDRKAWQKEHGFPESTGDFTEADFDRAMGICMDPVKKIVMDGCEAMDISLADLALEVLGQDTVPYLKHWNQLATRVEEEMKGGNL